MSQHAKKYSKLFTGVTKQICRALQECPCSHFSLFPEGWPHGRCVRIRNLGILVVSPGVPEYNVLHLVPCGAPAVAPSWLNENSVELSVDSLVSDKLTGLAISWRDMNILWTTEMPNAGLNMCFLRTD